MRSGSNCRASPGGSAAPESTVCVGCPLPPATAFQALWADAQAKADALAKDGKITAIAHESWSADLPGGKPEAAAVQTRSVVAL